MGSSSKDGKHSPKERHSSSSNSSTDGDKDDNHNEENVNNPPPAIHPNQAPYPMPAQPMGYPPQPSYGYGYAYGYGNGQYCNTPPQPYAGYPNGYPAGHGHPQAYYYPQGGAEGAAYYGTTSTVQQYNSTSTGFFRGFILCSFFMLSFLFIYSAIISLNLQPEAPGFSLESFSVSNFHAGNSNLTADWVSNIRVENHNKKLNAFFSNWKVTVVHQHVGIANSFWMGGFELGRRQDKKIDVVLSTNSHNSTLLIPDSAVEEIAKERGKGTITIGLGISTVITLRHESFASKSVPVLAYCKDLTLNFHRNSPNATAILNDANRNCELIDDDTPL